MWGVGIVNFVVNGLLLLGTGRLRGNGAKWFRLLPAAAVGSLYSILCLRPGWLFLGHSVWYTVSLAVICLIAWGFKESTLHSGAVFAILRLALEGIARGMGKGSAPAILPAAVGLGVLCFIGFRNNPLHSRFVPVEICHGDTRLRLTALRDTGNMLKDPMTGQPVLVIGAKAAQRLTGLTYQQLSSPVEHVGAIPGLRLVPYRSIGKGNGLMLALKIPDVQIGRWTGSSLVAFAPEGLGDDGGYDALTGGVT